jgi:hypothetical protein
MMMDLLEFVAGPTQVDRALNVIRGTTLIRAHSVNGGKGGRRYSDNALRQIAEKAEGLPAYLNHVSPENAFKPRDVRDLIGTHRNIRYFPTEGKIVSDLHVAEHHAPFVFGLAETAGGIIGNSLVSRGAVRMENGTEVVDEIELLRSADLVSDPATTKGLFESLEQFTQRKGAPPMNKTLQEVLVEEDAHERTSSALEHRTYFPPAVRQSLDALAEAIVRGKPVHDALALFFPAGRTPASTAPAEAPPQRPDAPRTEITQDIYEQLARASQR